MTTLITIVTLGIVWYINTLGNAPCVTGKLRPVDINVNIWSPLATANIWSPLATANIWSPLATAIFLCSDKRTSPITEAITSSIEFSILHCISIPYTIYIIIFTVHALPQGIKPGPADYQPVVTASPEKKRSYKPFGSAAPRLPEDGPDSKRPPGYVQVCVCVCV